VKGFTYADLKHHVFPERRPILYRGDTPILREGHIAQVHAERGIGKTWFVNTLGMIAAAGSQTGALGFSAQRPCRVANIDGEMDSQDIQGRQDTLGRLLNVPDTIPFTFVAADWQESFLPRIDTQPGQAAIEPYVADADLVIFANRSCLFDPEGEKDAAAWQAAQDYLLSLRRRGKAVIVAHHSNRLGGARGHSKPEDMLNLLIKLARPEGYTQDQGARFLVTFEKSRGAYGPAVAPFLAQLTPDGWEIGSATAHNESNLADKLREYVRLVGEAGDRPKSASAAITGAKVNRNAGFKAWAELTGAGQILKHQEGGFYVP
jgi:hypothetical protein